MRDSRTALLLAAGGLFGMLLSLTLVVSWTRSEWTTPWGALRVTFGRPELEPFDAIGVIGATIAGTLLGTLLVIVLVRRQRGGFDCPYCGARNRLEVVACSTCGERFRDGSDSTDLHAGG